MMQTLCPEIKMFLPVLIDICIWHPLLIWQEKIKRNSVLMRDKKKSKKIQPYCFLFVKHLSSGSPRIGLNHLSFDQMCYQVDPLPKKIFFKIKFQMPIESNNNNVISCIGYRHDDNLLQYLNCSANAKKLYLVYSVIECRIHQCQQ